MARKTPAEPEMDKGLRDVIGIVLFALSVFFLVSLFSFDPADLPSHRVPSNPEQNQYYHNMAGALGAKIGNAFFFAFGAAAYLLPPALFIMAMGQFFDFLGFLRHRWPWLIIWAICLMGAIDLFPTPFENVKNNIGAPSAGGFLGMILNDWVFERWIGKAGAAILFVLLYLIGFIYLTNFEVNEWVRAWKLPSLPFLKTTMEKEEELKLKALALEREAKKLKKAMMKTGQLIGDSLPLEEKPKSKRKRKKEPEPEEVEDEIEPEEGDEDWEDIATDPKKEPNIRDLSQPTARTDGDDSEDQSELGLETGEHVMEEGETITAVEVERAAATTDDILGKDSKPEATEDEDAETDEAKATEKEDTGDVLIEVADDEVEEFDADDDEKEAEVETIEPEIVEVPKPKTARKKAARPRVKPVSVASTPVIENYNTPAMNILHYAEPSNEPSETKEELLENAMLMKRVLEQFKIEVSPGDITKGPTITRYELHPAAGIKLEKIANLGNNLTAALKAERINILAPVPGKSSVGIEVPNRVKTKVMMRDLFESPDWEKSKHKIPVALGKDVYGQPLIGDLAEMPHLLIAGSTGSGKSVCISAIIASLLYKFSPEELRMVMIDPKVVELQMYNSLPHLVVPVVTDPKKVILALRWVVNEMENRYKIFAKVGVRNVHSFNKRPKDKPKSDAQQELPLTANKEHVEAGAEGFAVEVDEEIVVPREDDIIIPDKLSYIVVIIDELADLMLVAPADVEMAIARITQMARAAGIHMIVATQRPSVDVITGVIKANIPARCAFQVASKVDSRTILDAMGADKLLGKGDMLYLPPGSAKLIRAQGALISDEEIQEIVSFITNQGKPSYEKAIHQQLEQPAGVADVEQGASNEDEDIIQSCIEVIRSEQKASVSLLQRRLRLGYTRAARIMDELEQRGIVGPSRGAEPREILIDLDGEGYGGG